MGLGLLAPDISLPNLYPPHVGTSPLCICTLPTSLNVRSFFNSVVVRLPFILISVGSEWWWFYILVVILM